MKKYDVIIIGAGASGLAAAGALCARGRRVAILEMGASPARKVMASGGGRCNITNTNADYTRYFGKNRDFVRGALSRVSPHDIIAWAYAHNLQLVEKAPGQYFCENGAAAVVDALLVDATDADIIYNTRITDVRYENNMFYVNDLCADSVIVATGGTSFGALGVSDAGYKIAKSFGHKIVPVRPALCALAVPNIPPALAGVSLVATITVGKEKIHDSLLFTHIGIGGPAAYRASLHDLTVGLHINLVPNVDILTVLRNAKQTNGRKTVVGILGQYLPARVAQWISSGDTRHIADLKDCEIQSVAKRTCDIFIPHDDIKYHTLSSAEVVRGGIDTCDISSKTMESKLQPGLFFTGEVIDIAGDLGGFNLHWAWASGRVAGANA